MISIQRSESMKGSFLIKAKDKKIITEKGIRAFVMDRMLNSPLTRGTAFNVDDKTVEVRVEGEEKHIKEFIAQLKKDMTAMRGLALTESKVRRVIKYYKSNDKLPEDWKYTREGAKLLVG